MTNPQGDQIHPNQRRRLMIALLIVALVLVVGTIIVIVAISRGGQMSASDHPTSSAQPATTAPADPTADAKESTMQPSPLPGAVLPEAMGGQEAIDALGDRIELVAQRNGTTVEDLKKLLLRDKTAQVSTTGHIVYLDTFKNEG